MVALTLASVLPRLKPLVDELASHQIDDPSHPGHGGIMRPALGLVDPSAVTSGTFLFAAAAMVVLDPRPEPAHELLPRMDRALDHLLRVQNDAGRIDFIDCNPDSAPDTAFLAEQLVACVRLGRSRSIPFDAWSSVESKMLTFLRRAAPGIATGGFHTPNHRWVIAAALAGIMSVVPDVDERRAIASLLEEGIDIDGDGFFSERSIGVYDAVCVRAMLELCELNYLPEGFEFARRCLQTDAILLNADFTAETALSHRYDRGQRLVPLSLAPCYVHAAFACNEPQFLAVAAGLCRAEADDAQLRSVAWLAHTLARFGEHAPPALHRPVPATFHFPLNGLARVRCAKADLTVLAQQTNVLSIVAGAVRLLETKISQAYMGVGRFVGDDLLVDGDTLTVRSRGQRSPSRPAYELPLGRRLDDRHANPHWWTAAVQERPMRRFPPADTQVTLRVHEHSIDLQITSLACHPSVPSQITFDFPVGASLTDATGTRLPASGEVIPLATGSARVTVGDDWIELDLGARQASAHQILAMRDAEPPGDGSFRILVALLTPLDLALQVRWSPS